MGGARRLGARRFCPGGRKVATLSSSSSIFGEPPSRGMSGRGACDGYVSMAEIETVSSQTVPKLLINWGYISYALYSQSTLSCVTLARRPHPPSRRPDHPSDYGMGGRSRAAPARSRISSPSWPIWRGEASRLAAREPSKSRQGARQRALHRERASAPQGLLGSRAGRRSHTAGTQALPTAPLAGGQSARARRVRSRCTAAPSWHGWRSRGACLAGRAVSAAPPC